MKISGNDWKSYIGKLERVNQKAANLMQAWMDENPAAETEDMIAQAYALANYYGEAAATLACRMHDELAAAQQAETAPAVPAETATYAETAKAVQGTLKNRRNSVPDTVARLVKQTGADTTLQNAARDGAEFAWVPMGDTCAFCITLASRGWQRQSRKAMKNGHAEHIHAHCDCEYAIRFDGKSTVEGYDPDKYLEMYKNAEGDTPKEKINAMRREIREQNKDKINGQKRIAYQSRKERAAEGEKKIVITPTKRTNTPTDVTAEYFSSAKPGTGRITYQPGYDMGKRHEVERAGAQWIHDTLGGDVTLLTETNGQNEKTPDLFWRDSLWDWKNVSTEKAANSAVRHGLQQIRLNPGGIVLNYTVADVDMEAAISVINKRMQWSRDMQTDILVIREGKLEKALRYNKK